MQTTLLAPLAFWMWPVLAIIIFNRVDRSRAIILCMLIPFMFLPAGFGYDPPLLPPLKKSNLPSLAIMLILAKSMAAGLRYENIGPVAMFVFVLSMIAIAMSSLTNQDALVIGGNVLPGETIFDLFARSVKHLSAILPFFIGLIFLKSAEDHAKLISLFVICGLIYSIFVILELRLSPQFHNWTYGYFPHLFIQNLREGGWRPVVYQSHGLWLAFFMAMTVAAAATLWRSQAMRGVGGASAATRADQLVIFVLIYLAAVLFLCRSLASTVYGGVAVLLIVFAGMRFVLLSAAVFGTIAILYPVLRYTGLFPVETITDLAYMVDYGRGASLSFRFNQEAELLARATERPIFGWGTYGRNRVFSEDFGADVSVTDGYWVIVFGTLGFVGFVGVFGMLVAPIYMIWRHRAKIKHPATVGLTLMLSLNVVELLPNSTITPWTWLIAGSLVGYVINLKVDSSEEKSTLGKEVQKRRRTVI